MITTLFIDFGGVLTKGRYTATTIKNLEKKAGKKLENAYNEIDGFIRLLDLDSITFEEFTKRTNGLTGLKMSAEEMAVLFEKSVLWDKEMLFFLSKLKKDFRLALFSNNNHVTIRILKTKHKMLLKLFDRHFFSCELKMRKPDKKIFEHVLKEMKLKPEECLLIDDKEKNIKAAQEIGMKGIVFENTGRLKKEMKKLGVI